MANNGCVSDIMSVIENKVPTDITELTLQLLFKLLTNSIARKKFMFGNSYFLQLSDLFRQTKERSTKIVILKVVSKIAEFGAQTTKEEVKSKGGVNLLMSALSDNENDFDFRYVASDSLTYLFRPSDLDDEVEEEACDTGDEEDFENEIVDNGKKGELNGLDESSSSDSSNEVVQPVDTLLNSLNEYKFEEFSSSASDDSTENEIKPTTDLVLDQYQNLDNNKDNNINNNQEKDKDLKKALDNEIKIRQKYEREVVELKIQLEEMKKSNESNKDLRKQFEMETTKMKNKIESQDEMLQKLETYQNNCKIYEVEIKDKDKTIKLLKDTEEKTILLEKENNEQLLKYIKEIESLREENTKIKFPCRRKICTLKNLDY